MTLSLFCSKKSVRRVFTVILTFFMIIECSVTSYAKDTPGHNKEIEGILFNGGKCNQTEELSLILDALYLTVDQYQGNGKEHLDHLKTKYGSEGKELPGNISNIDFSASSEHRKYTHRGWDFKYSYKPNNYTASWQTTWTYRKGILLYTVNKVLDFSNDEIEDGGKYSKRCDSFCALLYYLHLIGDHEEDHDKNSNRKNVFEDKMGVGGLCDKVSLGDKDIHNPLNLDMIDEILAHSAILFSDQTLSPTYILYTMKLKSLDSKFKKIVDEDGAITDYEKYYIYTEELKSILTKNLYKMLQKEEYFSNTFYEP